MRLAMNHHPDTKELIPLKTLDPQSSDAPESIVSALFDSLAVYDAKGVNLQPWLATKWEKNSDATVWTFYLRKEAKWSDGKPITASDFVYSWKGARDDLVIRSYYLSKI